MIGLEISSVQLNIDCTSGVLTQMIVERMHEYLHNGSPDYIIKIKWEGQESNTFQRQDAIERIEGKFNRGVYVISSPWYEGWIDPVCGEAELSLVSGRPLFDVEYFLRIVLSYGLYDKGGFLFHSSGIVQNGNGYLFFGKSGSGKTTVAQNSMGYVILSDDLVGVRPLQDRVIAFSTPFWNPGWTRREKAQAPVSGIYRLVKSPEVFIEPIRESLAVSEMISSIPIVPLNPEFCDKLIPVVQTVISRVGVNYLYFKKDNTFWPLIMREDGMGKP